MEEAVDVVVVGGGIIGCSIAMELATRRSFQEVFLLEKGPYLGDGTSTRNSYVLHAGIYYPESSAKARFCVEGRHLQFSFCKEHRIPVQKSGKIIVARHPDEVPGLEDLKKRGEANGVEGLRLLDGKEVRKLEPHVSVAAGLLSPVTGVFDVASWFRVADVLLYERGVTVLKKTRVTGLEPGGENMQVETDKRGKVPARFLVNAAGLFSDEVGNLLGNRFRIHPVRGDYLEAKGRSADLVVRAIYPVPGKLGLGIHLTRLWDGILLVGPDARRLTTKEDYRTPPVFDPAGEIDTNSDFFNRFYEPVQAFLPEIERGDLRLAHCGIRPSLKAPGDEGFHDFHIDWDENHPNVIHLVGIDSPGLTAAPAIARHVADMLESRRG